MKAKKLISLLLAAVMILSLAACGAKEETTAEPVVEIAGGTTETPAVETEATETTETEELTMPDEYTRGDDAEIYDAILGEYQTYMTEANATQDLNERYVRFAMAEAALLDAAVARPYSNCSSSYMVTRIAPHTSPLLSGADMYDVFATAVVSSDIITEAEREEMTALWEAEAAGGEVYDAEAYLTSQGHEILHDITLASSSVPQTLDTQGSIGDELTLFANTQMTLLANDTHGNLIPWLAESYDISDDGLTYTFYLRQGVKWFTSEGKVYGEVTAEDFVAGMQHFMDYQPGTESNCDCIAGAYDYYANGGSWDAVGIKAVDDYTVEITLSEPTPYFLSLCTYLYFRPLCKDFFLAHGGALGVQEYAEASNSTSYNYALSSDISTQVYCGPYRLTKLVANSEYKLVKNDDFFCADEISVNSVTYVYDDGSVPTQTAQAFLDGTYVSCYPYDGDGTKELIAEAGYEDSIFVAKGIATLYVLFDVNRASFSAGDDGKSVKLDDLALQWSCQQAMLNNNFRKALFCAFSAEKLNAAEAGESLAKALCRNTSTAADFVSLDADVTVDGYTFKAGTIYGDIVQFFADERGLDVNLEDGQDGWYNVERAQEYLAAAKEELGSNITWPIHLDIMIPDAGYGSYYIPLATTIKQSIEDALGAENVTVDLLITETLDGFYLGIASAQDLNTDLLYNMTWGTLFADPLEPLRPFRGYGDGVSSQYLGLF